MYHSIRDTRNPINDMYKIDGADRLEEGNPNPAQKENGSNITDNDDYKTRMEQVRMDVGRFVTYLIVLLSIYSLVLTHINNNEEAVTNACGPELWELLLVRVVVGTILMEMFFGCCSIIRCSSPTLTSIAGYVYVFTMFIFPLMFMVLEAVLATQAMQSSACLAALDNANANTGRMLPIMLYAFAGMDCLVFFVFGCGCCHSCSKGGSYGGSQEPMLHLCCNLCGACIIGLFSA